MTENTYDAIVIGSGISGGWAAKELTEKGLKTIMLERGRYFEHIKDYKSAGKDPWDFPHRGKVTQAQRDDRPYISRTWGAVGADHRLLGKGYRLSLYGNKAVQLVAGLSIGRTVDFVGPAKLPVERF